MKKLLALVITALAAITAPSAFGAANSEQASCIALFTTSQPAGQVGQSASSSAHEVRPFGVVVVSFSAHMRAPCGE